jgi:hypothetical protein
MTIVPTSVFIFAVYFFFGSISIAGGVFHCIAILFSLVK